jgi:hypothetical protein
MSWAYKITIGMVLFSGFVFTLVFKMITSGNDLVKSKYYASGKDINQRIITIENSQNLENRFHIEVRSNGLDGIVLHFDSVQTFLEGEIELTCLSSDRSDQKTKLDLEKSEGGQLQKLALNRFAKGNWICEIEGKNGNSPFIIRQEFRINP